MKKVFSRLVSSVLTATMLTSSLVISTPVSALAAPSISAGGWNETLFANISGVSDSDVTAVSYSGAMSGSLTGEDFTYLVRDENGGVRVDIPGLKAGTYSITVSTKSGNATASNVVVPAQDRSGYAHFNYSEGVGAYNDDGTLKANAKVLYVTDANKNSVSVTAADGTTVTGIGNILNTAGKDVGTGVTDKGGIPNTNAGILQKLADANTPLVVRFIGTVKNPEGTTAYDSIDYGGSLNDNGAMARMKSGKNITIEGIGNNTTIDGWGFHFIAAGNDPAAGRGKNFEARNLSFRNVPEDCLGMEGQYESSTLSPVERCWVHNCSFYAPTIANPAESDKDGGDGACDFKRGQYFTNSYNYYEGYHKTNLVGSGDSDAAGPQYHLTYHHNYWKNCDSRGPLARKANIHMYNNVFEGQTSYCMNPRVNAYIFSEYNLFYQCKNPATVTSGGVIKSYNNSFSACIEENAATVVNSRSEKVSNSNTYSDFDTNSSVSYIPSGNYDLQEDVTEAKTVVLAQAGTMKANPVLKDESAATVLSSDRQPTGSVVLPYKHDLNNAYISSKNATIDNVIFNINKFDASSISTTTDAIGQNIVFNVNTAVNITMTDGGATYPVVLMNDKGVGFLTGTGTAYNVPAGTYIIQSSGFQPGKSTTPLKYKEAKISYLAIEAADGSAPTVAEPTTQATTAQVATEATTKAQTGETTETTTESTTPVVPSGSQSHNFTTDEKNSTFYTFEGDNLASKGEVEYGGATLTKSLKLNSKGKVTFTNTKSGKLTLVFNSINDGNVIKIDETEYTIPYTGIVTADVAAGTHNVVRSSGESFLYYINYTDNGAAEETSQATTEATTEATTKAQAEETTEATTQAPVAGYNVSVGSVTGKTGETIVVPVKVTGGIVGYYTAEVSYDADKLQFVSAAAGNSDEGIDFDYNDEGGKVTVAATNANGIDTELLFNLTFTAKATGTANVSLTFTEIGDENENEITPSVSNGTVGVTDDTVKPSRLGDVDKDGDVDRIDAELLIKHISGVKVVTDPVSLVNADCDGKTGINMLDVIWILNNPYSKVEETTQVTTKATTTEATTEATTKAQETTEATTQAPVSGLTALDAGSYNASSVLSDTARFAVSGNTSTTQIKINESGYVEFAVKDGASVTVNYKCGSTTTSKTAGLTLNGQTSPSLAGGAAAVDFTVSGLSAGTYKIAGVQTGGTTVQIISITVAYGSVVETTTEATTKATTQATTQATTKEATTEATTQAPVVQAQVHNFNDGKTSSFYTITGNLSTSKGTVTYGGSTITQCLKMESSTLITFKGNGVLTLVFDTTSAGCTVKLDGEAYAIPADGILVIEDMNTAATTHELTKGSGSSFLFYMSLNGSGATEPDTETTSKSSEVTTKGSEATTKENTETTTKNSGGSTGDDKLTDTSSLSVVKTITSNSASELSSAISTLNKNGGKIVIDTPKISVSSNLKISGTKKGAIVGVKQADGTYPVIDFSGQSYGTRGMTISGSNQIIQNIIVEKAGDNGIWVSGGNNVMEHVIARYNHDSGIQLSDNANGNTLRYCYSYRNCDTKTYGANADGFAPKLGASNTVFEYCYAWDNSDDGWDSYDKSGDKSATVTYLHSACWNNGNTAVYTGEYDKANNFSYGTKDPNLEIQNSSWVSQAEGEMNGNGFKFGSKTTEASESVIRTARYCIAFDHKAKGFDNNNSTVCSGYFENCMSFDNQRNYSLPYTIKQWDNIYGWDYTQSNTANSTPKEPIIPSNGAELETEIRKVRNEIIKYVYENKMPDDYNVNFDHVFAMAK